MEKEEINELVRQRLVHEIHTSERKSFRGCRRRWNWIFREFYYPKITAKPLEFGVAFHNAMEVLYNPDTWKFDREVVLNSAIKMFMDTCNEQRKLYLDNKDAYDLGSEEAEQDYDERIELGKGMLQYYAHEVAPYQDQGWTPINVEVEFVVPIQDPDTDEYLFCKCQRCRKTYEDWCHENGGIARFEEDWEGLPVCLAGRIDMLAEDQHGHYWIVDWKTAASISRERGDEFLYLDDQIASYVMALRRKLGLDVRGFLYIELRKAFPVEPKQNTAPRLGRMYSVNKNQAVDYNTYKTVVEENDTEAFEAGLYDEFLEFLKNEGTIFHQRYQIVKTDYEMYQIEKQLYKEAKEMTSPTLPIYPSPGRFTCGFCAFRQPCLEVFAGGDYQYILDELFEKRKHHYWVKNLSTDKQGGE